MTGGLKLCSFLSSLPSPAILLQRLPLSGPFYALPVPGACSVPVLPTWPVRCWGREIDVDSKRQRKAWHRISAQFNKRARKADRLGAAPPSLLFSSSGGRQISGLLSRGSSRRYMVGHTQMPWTSVRGPPTPSSPAASLSPTLKERCLEGIVRGSQNGPPSKCPGWWEQAVGWGRGGKWMSLSSTGKLTGGGKETNTATQCAPENHYLVTG